MFTERAQHIIVNPPPADIAGKFVAKLADGTLDPKLEPDRIHPLSDGALAWVPPICRGCLRSADFFFLRFAVLVHAADLVGKLLFELGDVFVFPVGERFVDLPFQEDLLLGDLRFGRGFEFGNFGLLSRGESVGRGLFFETFHGEFVGAFHEDVEIRGFARSPWCSGDN